jgi:hypothetical protein
LPDGSLELVDLVVLGFDEEVGFLPSVGDGVHRLALLGEVGEVVVAAREVNQHVRSRKYRAGM